MKTCKGLFEYLTKPLSFGLFFFFAIACNPGEELKEDDFFSEGTEPPLASSADLKAPADFSVHTIDDHTDKISFSQVEGAKAYRLYYSDSAGRDFSSSNDFVSLIPDGESEKVTFHNRKFSDDFLYYRLVVLADARARDFSDKQMSDEKVTQRSRKPGESNRLPTLPGRITFSKLTDGSIGTKLTWRPAIDPDGSVAGYEVSYKIARDPFWSKVEVAENSREIRDLFSHQTYQFRVRAKDNDGAFGPYVQELYHVGERSPLPPRSFEVSKYNAGGSHLHGLWFDSGVNNPDKMRDYLLSYRKKGSFAWSAEASKPYSQAPTYSSRSHRFEGLEPETEYEIRIRVRARSGETSAYLFAAGKTRTAVNTAPTAPSDFVATSGYFADEVFLNWKHSTDDGFIRDYLLSYRKSGSGEWSEEFGVNHFFFDAEGIDSRPLGGLEKDTSYDFRIRAEDGTGRESGIPGARGLFSEYASASVKTKASTRYAKTDSGKAAKDNEGPLYWQSDGTIKGLYDENVKVNHADAASACNELVLDGFSDWRLPTIDELKEVAPYHRRSNPFDNSDKNRLSTDYYWSKDSSTDRTKQKVLAINKHPKFVPGQTFNSKVFHFPKDDGFAMFYRCVRSD